MASDQFIDISRVRSIILPSLVTAPIPSAPSLADLNLFVIKVSGSSFIYVPMQESMSISICKNMVCKSNAMGMPSHELSFQAVCPRNEKVRALEQLAGLGSFLARIKLRNVKFGASRVCVDHVLGPGFVALDQILQAVNRMLLQKGFDPSTSPSK